MSYNNDLVSTVIPMYNAETTIAFTIESVLKQTYNDIELIIVDDCSTDSSGEIVEEYSKKYPSKIKVFTQSRNQGVSAARNRGINESNGRYVAFLDSDDLWKPEKTVRQLGLLDKTNAPLCYTAIEKIDINNNLVKGKIDISERCSYKKLLRNTMIATSTVMIDRNITGDVVMPKSQNENGKYWYAEDYATWLSIIHRYGDAVGINEALVQYRVGEGDSLSKNKYKSARRYFRTQVEIEGIMPIFAFINSCFYAVNGFIKHYVKR